MDDERPGACTGAGANRLPEPIARRQAVFASQHAISRVLGSLSRNSDGQALAALGATVRQDCAAGTGPHAQTEAVHLVTTTVVRLVSTLAHGCFSDARSGWADTVHWWPRRRLGGGSLSAGTAHPRSTPGETDSLMGRPWTCGTGRHRVTAQRYASHFKGVKPARPYPVDEVLPRAPIACYVRSCPQVS